MKEVNSVHHLDCFDVVLYGYLQHTYTHHTYSLLFIHGVVMVSSLSSTSQSISDYEDTIQALQRRNEVLERENSMLLQEKELDLSFNSNYNSNNYISDEYVSNLLNQISEGTKITSQYQQKLVLIQRHLELEKLGYNDIKNEVNIHSELYNKFVHETKLNLLYIYNEIKIKDMSIKELSVSIEDTRIKQQHIDMRNYKEKEVLLNKYDELNISYRENSDLLETIEVKHSQDILNLQNIIGECQIGKLTVEKECQELQSQLLYYQGTKDEITGDLNNLRQHYNELMQRNQDLINEKNEVDSLLLAQQQCNAASSNDKNALQVEISRISNQLSKVLDENSLLQQVRYIYQYMHIYTLTADYCTMCPIAS